MARRKPTRPDIFCSEDAHKDTLKSIRDDPDLWVIYEILNHAGGKYIYIEPSDAAYWKERLIADGEFYTPRPGAVSYRLARKYRLVPYNCYNNSLIIQSSRDRDSRYVPCIGYSLMTLEDCWIQHTWLQFGKQIVETTPLRSSVYYGISTTYKELWAWQEYKRWEYD